MSKYDMLTVNDVYVALTWGQPASLSAAGHAFESVSKLMDDFATNAQSAVKAITSWSGVGFQAFSGYVTEFTNYSKESLQPLKKWPPALEDPGGAAGALRSSIKEISDFV